MNSRTRALLVYPELPPTYWGMKYAMPFIGKRASMPPLGLMTIASMLPRAWDLSLVDLNVEPLTRERIDASDLVLVSAMLVQKESFERVVAACGERGRRVVAGGPYPTSCQERIEGVDHFVLGEAEVTLPCFLADFAAGRAQRVYRGESRPDLSLTPPPRFDLIRLKRYATMALQYSRGCPHTCEFCDIVELFGRTPRTKSPAQFLKEVDLLHAAGWRGSVFVVDDNFIGNARQAKALLQPLADWQQRRGYPFAFFTEATLALAQDEELMSLMVRAGFNMVFLGIETPHEETLASAGKSQNLKSDMLAAVRTIQSRGMEVSAGFVLGFDTDPDDIFDRQIGFIQSSGVPTAMVGLLTALPRTRLHRRLGEEGRLLSQSSGGNTHDLRLNFVPRMDVDKLLDGYKRVLAEIYAPDRYFARCLDLLRSMKVHRTSSRRISATELRAFALSLVRQTFSWYSPSYVKFLVKGALARPRLLAETVTMAVKGHHFFTMTRNLLEVDRFQRRLDELARALREKSLEVSAGNTDRVAELRAWRDRVLAKMNRRYRRLDADFRVYAEEAIARFQASTDELLAALAAS